MKNFLWRFISTIILGIFIIWLLNTFNIYTRTLGLIFFVLIASLSISEFHHFFISDLKPIPGLCYLSQFTFILIFFWIAYTTTSSYLKHLSMIGALFILFLIYSISLFFIPKSKEAFYAILISFSPLLFFILPLCAMIPIYAIDYEENERNLFFLIAATKSGDIGAYTFGVLTANLTKKGNHKMFPSVSPKKSWEGFIGGLITSIVIAWLICAKLQLPITPFIKNNWIAISVILYIGAVFGDLMESLYKRIAMIKDSGNLVPGIGGVLDLIDSLVFNSLIIYFIFLLN